MFEISLDDVKRFKIQSLKLYDDANTRYMALLVDVVLAHVDIPTVQLIAHGGLVITGSYHFDISTKDKQDIISAQAVFKIEQLLIDLMDTWTEFAFRARIGRMY